MIVGSDWLLPVKWNLATFCRIHRITIRDLKAESGYTLKRIREIREAGVCSNLDADCLVQAGKRIAARRNAA